MTVSSGAEADQLLVETLDQLLADCCPQEVVSTPDRWASVWDRLVEFGAPLIGIDESAGGLGGTNADALAVLRLCGKHAAPTPIAMSGFVGAWLLSSVGIDLPDATISVVPNAAADSLKFERGRLEGSANHVPFARSAEILVALVDGHVVTFQTDDATLHERANLAGEPRDHVELQHVTPLATSVATEGLREAFAMRFQLARCAQMTGALEAVAELTVDYAKDREQFGRPIVSFQAVAHRLVELVEEVCLARMALDATTAALTYDASASFEVAALRAVIGQSVTSATAASHQIHGAIGMTEEYRLHHFTRRLWAWNIEVNGTAAAEAAVGAIAAAEPDNLWSSLTGQVRTRSRHLPL